VLDAPASEKVSAIQYPGHLGNIWFYSLNPQILTLRKYIIMSPLRIGVVGAGRLGTHHARCLQAVSDAELIGIHDVDRSRAQSLANETASHAFSEYDKLLDKVDAVVIAADTKHHYHLGMEAARQGKHLFIEKPIAATVEQGHQLIEAARARRLKLQIGHVERYNRAYRSLSGFSVLPRFIETHRLSQFNPRGTDVAVILDLMIHDLDLILHLVNADIDTIDASGVAIVSDTIDIANARLSFNNGCVANVTASRISQRKMRKMRIFSPDSYVSMDFVTGKTDIFRLADTSETQSKPGILALGEIEKGQRKLNILFDSPQAEDANAIEMELMDFVHAVIHNTPEKIPGEDGLKALDLAVKITTVINEQSKKFPIEP
jgi:predicted dehydrogenase